MKEFAGPGVLLFLIITLLGCGAVSREITLRSQSDRTDVFKEAQGGEPIPREFADLTIKSSIKTHFEGHYLLESKRSLHGKAGYPFVINIDGQAATWKVDGQKENSPTYDQEGKRFPEGGEGMRYNLEKKILLQAGSHKIFFGLPEEKLSLQFELALKAGDSNVLEFRPVYQRRGKQPRHFFHGVSTCEVLLNGNAIKLLK